MQDPRSSKKLCRTPRNEEDRTWNGAPSPARRQMPSIPPDVVHLPLNCADRGRLCGQIRVGHNHPNNPFLGNQRPARTPKARSQSLHAYFAVEVDPADAARHHWNVPIGASPYQPNVLTSLRRGVRLQPGVEGDAKRGSNQDHCQIAVIWRQARALQSTPDWRALVLKERDQRRPILCPRFIASDHMIRGYDDELVVLLANDEAEPFLWRLGRR
jgi:hypothetical protein